VLLGKGDGTFQSAVDYRAGHGSYSVAIGDLDGDGALDLAVPNWWSSTVSVLLGTGDGTFQSPFNYGAGYRPCSVEIGDLDGDGAPDLAVANWSSYNVSVLLGNGDGTFRSAVHYGAGEGPYSIAIGDLDGDGAPDLAVANEGRLYTSGNVSALLGNGDGTFQSAINYGAGDRPYSVAIGDLDGDGALDLAVANLLSDNVSVLINSSLSRFERVYPKGWSMISLPVDPSDKRLNKLFPEAGVVYGYEKGTGYVPVEPDEDMKVGKGYWILFDNPQSYVIKGTRITEYTMPVDDGWYMIGGCTLPARKMVTSGNIDVIYGYTQGVGYTRLVGSKPLERGKGYWILFSNTSEGAEFTASTPVAQ
jgi:hypothetical protein